MEQVGKNLVEALTEIHTHMVEALKSAENREQGAQAALKIYYENEQLITEVGAALTDIIDLGTLLEKGLEQMREQRAKREARAVTMRGHGTTVVKLVPCGKHCSGCPHGPYAYRVTKVNGKQVWKYLGKA